MSKHQAVDRVNAGEVVAVKAGHTVTAAARARLPARLQNSDVQSLQRRVDR